MPTVTQLAIGEAGLENSSLLTTKRITSFLPSRPRKPKGFVSIVPGMLFSIQTVLETPEGLGSRDVIF